MWRGEWIGAVLISIEELVTADDGQAEAATPAQIRQGEDEEQMPDENSENTPQTTPPASDGGNQSGDGARTFTQAEVASFVAEERRKLRGQYADYDDLKAAKDELDALKQEELSEVEKLRAKLEKAEQQAADAQRSAEAQLIRAAFIAEASKHGVKNPADAYALADRSEVAIDESGDVVGVEAAVKALVEAGRLPLASGSSAPPLDGGAGDSKRPGRTTTLTANEKAMAQAFNMTEEEYIKYMNPAQAPASNDELDKLRG